MRIGTQTLKVTTWLSAATFALIFLCGTASFGGWVLLIERQSWMCGILRGEFAICSGLVDGRTDVHIFKPGTNGSVAGTPQLPRLWIMKVKGHWQAGTFVIPLWLPAAMCLAIGVPAFVTLRRRDRAIKNGTCPKCGYMLTGLSPAAPCPECGRVAR